MDEKEKDLPHLGPSELEPVTRIEGLDPPVKKDEPRKGIALCLSGGGYRAMLFHAGALKRLNELGYLPKFDRVSSVSGGSIAAGVLAANWSALKLDPSTGAALNFDALVVGPIRRLAGITIDVPSILWGIVDPGGSVSEKIAAAYRRHLFGEKTLKDLPARRPKFIFNATSLQSGVLWRFARSEMGDYRVGRIANPEIRIATAVAASSAFPPVLSPLVLPLGREKFEPKTELNDLRRPPFTTRAVLTDGGVYDNLGLESAWKDYDTILVSDAGGKMAAEDRPAARNWPLQMFRVLNVVDNQVRSLRKRQVIGAFKTRRRGGTYWGIRTDILKYDLKDALPCPEAKSLKLAEVPTRLAALEGIVQERLINWGYAVCDAAMRKHVVEPKPPAPVEFPYPKAGIG